MYLNNNEEIIVADQQGCDIAIFCSIFFWHLMIILFHFYLVEIRKKLSIKYQSRTKKNICNVTALLTSLTDYLEQKNE